MDPTVAIRRAILVPTNNISHSINKRVLQTLEGPSKTYCSADCVDTTDDPAAEMVNYTIEFLNSLTPSSSGLPPHKLVLKEGAVIILLRNLNLKTGLCNGTRLIVRLLGNQYIDAEKTDSSGRPTGERVFIPRIDLKTGGDTLPLKLKRRQFPVQLAYTMTIHKSQGQTFNRMGIYLEEPVFTHGQLYVAFS
ncbi:ATP-dependent DNA helicase PIF1-like [Anoplophora glabripennis]|uniref:ATP-dependent DNA helicase PIF1-like n=1 Tax=Anoplophora glabripennis TaxID=217634 RepID=UPI0008752D98|nr:ATP-dependent DNA helicase PIF1-like [Anoplophora glabripennis]